MASLVICILMVQIVAGNEQYRSDSLLNHLNTGMKFAKDFLGSESVALKVADFVVRAFQPTSSLNKKRPQPDSSKDYINENYSEESKPSYNTQEVPYTMSPLRHLVRLLGLQPKHISAVAVNALIFVAQMITTFLAGPRRPNKSHRSEDFMEWILNKNSRKLQDLLETARNDSLPNMIEDLILDNNKSEEETSCIRLLICKITPFVNKMQKAVFGVKNDDLNFSEGRSFMYRHLPTNEEFNSKSEICEQKHKDCKLYE